MLFYVQLEGRELVMSVTEFEAAVQAGRIGPDTPVRAADAPQFVHARDLPIFQGMGDDPAVRIAQAWSRPVVPWMTALIVGICVRVFMWVQTNPHAWADEARFARFSPAILENREVYRLITYGLLHSGFDHIAMNLLFIAWAGVALERLLGPGPVGAIFLASVVGGGLLSTFASPDTPSLGASAGDFGVLAAAVVFGWRYWDAIPRRARPGFGGSIMVFTVWGFANGLLSAKVDNWAHFGGLVVGLLLMPWFRPVDQTGRNRMVTASVVGGTGVLLGGLWLLGPRLVPLTAIEEDGLVTLRPEWWTPGVSPAGLTGWTSPTRRSTLSVSTLHMSDPTSIEEEADAILERYTNNEAGWQVVSRQPQTIDSVPALALRLESPTRGVDAWVAVRGNFVHSVVLDMPLADDALRDWLVRTLQTATTLPPPEVWVAAEESFAADSWRARVERGKARTEVGDYAGAAADLAVARQLAPREPAVALALLELARVHPGPDTSAVDALWAAFPGQRKVQAAAIRALVAAGETEKARSLLEQALVDAPGDRSLGRVKEELGL